MALMAREHDDELLVFTMNNNDFCHEQHEKTINKHDKPMMLNMLFVSFELLYLVFLFCND